MIRKLKNGKDVQVIIGQPIVYPEKLISFLRKNFKENKDISNAYLACVQNFKDDKSSRLVIGIDTNNDLSAIVASLEDQLYSLSILEKIDFIKLKSSPFENYLLKTEPFYSI